MSDADAVAGLCATCVHCRIVQAARSTFYLCARSFDDPRFRKYPPLPVVRCIGYQPGEGEGPPEPPKEPFSPGSV